MTLNNISTYVLSSSDHFLFEQEPGREVMSSLSDGLFPVVAVSPLKYPIITPMPNMTTLIAAQSITIFLVWFAIFLLYIYFLYRNI